MRKGRVLLAVDRQRREWPSELIETVSCEDLRGRDGHDLAVVGLVDTPTQAGVLQEHVAKCDFEGRVDLGVIDCLSRSSVACSPIAGTPVEQFPAVGV